jgi:dihydroorotase
MSLLLKNGQVYYKDELQILDILIEDNQIKKVEKNISDDAKEVKDCTGLTIFPGFIDTHVHFREPGHPKKETLESGSRAAVLGGITGIFEMPNTSPITDNKEMLEDKLSRAKDNMHCNYAFYFGATNENSDKLDFLKGFDGCCGVKMFVGSSTGDLLVKDDFYIEQVIKNSPRIVSIHSEDEDMLIARKNIIEEGNVKSHYKWRSVECAVSSTKKLIAFANKHKKNIHILHITTKDEVDYVRENRPGFVTLETTPQHLTLYAPDIYDQLDTFAQINPPIRTKDHRDGIWKGVDENLISIIGSDHSPHTKEEKKQPYPQSPSGMPGTQTIGLIMTDYFLKGKISLKKLVDLLCINPCKIFGIKNRGALKTGNIADLTIYKLNEKFTIKDEWIESKCGWTPFNGTSVDVTPYGTIINGKTTVWNQELIEKGFGKPYSFN